MREYHAHETARMQELDGIALADFRPRAAAFIADVVFALASVMVVVMIWGLAKWLIETGGDTSRHRVYNFNLHDEPTRMVFELVVPVLYFGLSGYFWNGRSPGKRIFGIRVVSLVDERITLWQSIERALGYGAAALEFGFGFAQFVIHPFRRTAQDRLAETIVVTEAAWRERNTPAKAARPS